MVKLFRGASRVFVCAILPVLCTACPLPVPGDVPEVRELTLNCGDAATSSRWVTLNIRCTNRPTEYIASQNPDFGDASWEPYSRHAEFRLLPQLGTATIYFKTRNAVGESLLAEARIELIPPATITDLGEGIGHACAVDINAAGQVIGSSFNVRFDGEHAFVWDAENGMRYLGTLGGETVAFAISDRGEVVGCSSVCDFVLHAFLWTPSHGMQDMAFSWGYAIFAMDINDAGQVVCWGGFDRTVGFLWDPVTGVQNIEAPNGWDVCPYAVNNRGTVTGYCLDSSDCHGFIWDAVNGMEDIGSLGGTQTSAYDLNDSGQIVGSSDTADGVTRAFLWDRAQGMQELEFLATPRSEANGVNEMGVVVGSCEAWDGNLHAVVWDPVEGIRDLGTLGGEESVAYAINDAGQIVGYSQAPTGEWHAVLWAPIADE